MRVSPMRPEFRGPPPFAPAYVTYTHRLQALIEDLRGFMTVADLAAVAAEAPPPGPITIERSAGREP